MKSETFVSVVFPDVLPMVRRLTVVGMLACAAFMSTSALADNAVRFSGSLVNATCSIQTVTQASPPHASQLNVAPGVAVRVVIARDACDGQAAPFIARYTPVDVAVPQASRTEKAGVITLTYQ